VRRIPIWNATGGRQDVDAALCAVEKTVGVGVDFAPFA
jgi:hypothetical protein